MSTLKTKDWLFLLPDKEETSFVLYAPLHEIAVRLSNDFFEEFQTLINNDQNEAASYQIKTFLEENKLLKLPDKWEKSLDYDRTGAVSGTLALTNKCNLRCIYCYAATGTDFTTMPVNVAKSAIEHFIKVAVNRGQEKTLINFHGGGENFVEYDLMQKCVEFALELGKSKQIEVGFTAVTNGTLVTFEVAKWLKTHNFTQITVSLDGLPEVNDLQRPMADGSGSFSRVIEGVKNLKNAGINVSIRSTVSAISVKSMTKFVEYLSNEVLDRGDTVHFEPMHLCGRAVDNPNSTSTDLYLGNYTKAKEAAKQLGLKVTCTLDRFKNTKIGYCAATNASMFCVTPSGKVSGCTRVTKKVDEGSDLYFYGEYDSEKHSFNVNPDQKKQISEWGKLPVNCEECFARWTCQGNCPILRYTDPQQHYLFCESTREFLRRDILKLVHGR